MLHPSGNTENLVTTRCILCLNEVSKYRKLVGRVARVFKPALHSPLGAELISWCTGGAIEGNKRRELVIPDNNMSGVNAWNYCGLLLQLVVIYS